MSNNPLSPDYFATLSIRWMSINELRASLQRAKGLRTQHASLVTKLEGQIAATKNSLDASAQYLTSAERLTIVTRAVAAKRKELVASSAPQRHKLVSDINVEHQAIMAADLHYQSAVQILMRSSIGSPRRSLIAGQIQLAGPSELLSFAHLAASTNDQEMGAALVTRLSTMPATSRPFSSQSLAAALVGETYAEADIIFGEIEATIIEALAADKTFETGKVNAGELIKAALLKRNVEKRKASAQSATGSERDPIDRTLVRIEEKKPTNFLVEGTTLPNGGGVPETPAAIASHLEG